MQQMRAILIIYAYVQQEKCGLYNQPTVYNIVLPILQLVSLRIQIDAPQPSVTYAPMVTLQPGDFVLK